MGLGFVFVLTNSEAKLGFSAGSYVRSTGAENPLMFVIGSVDVM